MHCSSLIYRRKACMLKRVWWYSVMTMMMMMMMHVVGMGNSPCYYTCNYDAEKAEGTNHPLHLGF